MTPQDLIAAGALFVVSHSGGKDSQATLIRVLESVPRRQVVVVHADLGAVEWHGAKQHAQRQADDAGVPFVVANAIFEDGRAKTFLNKVEYQFNRRPDAPSFPSVNNRWCTSELKTGPIEKQVRAYAKAHGFKLIVMCDGIRADESEDRRKRVPFSVHKKLSVAGRQAWTWYPIFHLTAAEVFATIAAAGQQPHPAYAAGNERLSCVFCFLGSATDLAHGAAKRPELFKQYVELEQRTGYTLHMSGKSLADLVIEGANILHQRNVAA